MASVVLATRQLRAMLLVVCQVRESGVMATRASYPCSQPGCPARAVKGGRCATHQRQREQAYQRQRGTVTEQGYGAAWRKIRDQVLRDEPYCRECLAMGMLTRATDVDHIVARAKGGTDDITNLCPLCHKHHSSKTAREDGRWMSKG